MKKVYRELLIGHIFGATYLTIEVCYRGYSHLSMYLLAFVIGHVIGGLNEFYPYMDLKLQCLFGMIIATLGEGIVGIIVNNILHLNVWDYSNMPFNLLGQICLPFAIMWIPLSFLAILLDDYLRYNWFGEEKPSYRSIILEKIKSLKK